MRATAGLHPASVSDLGRLWPMVWPSRVFERVDEFEEYWAEAPWRVQVGSRGETVVLGRWREHLPYLAIRGMWCSPHRLASLLEEVRAIAKRQGFGGLLSPLVSMWEARAYESAGMVPVQEIVVLRMDRPKRRRARSSGSGTEDLRLEVATLRDLGGLMEVDREAFDDFWRYDEGLLKRYLSTDRAAVAKVGDRVVGYTFSAVSRGEGVLGRIAVHPDRQSRGVGTTLLDDTVDYFRRMGVHSITLCTQEENTASRRLYARAGFRESPERLRALAFRSLD